MADERREGFEEMVTLATGAFAAMRATCGEDSDAARQILQAAGVREPLVERISTLQGGIARYQKFSVAARRRAEAAERRVAELEAALRLIADDHGMDGAGTYWTVIERLQRKARAALSSPDRNTNREERGPC